MRKTSWAILLSILPSFTAGAATVIAGGTTNDTEGRIIRLTDGRLMAAIARNPYGSWSSTDVYVSFSPDGGATWGAPALAIGGAADQATIAALELPGDTIRLWYASSESGTYRIHTAWSVDGASWTAQGQLSLGWGSTVQCYDPTVILEPDSSLTMIYRGGSGTTAGAYAARRPRGGAWDTLRRPVNYRAYRPRIARHPDGTYLAAFQRQSGGSSTQIDVFVRRSTDLTNWTDSVRLTTNQNSHDAFCLQVPDSGYMVYYAKYQSAPYDAYNLCRRRSADGVSWQAEQQLTFDGDLHHNTQPCLALFDGRLGLAWAYANDYDNDNDVLFDSWPLAGVSSGPPNPVAVKGRLRLYPNPCPRGTAAVLDCVTGPAEARLFDAGGRFIRRVRLEIGHPALVATADLSPGVYFVTVGGGRGMTARLTVLPQGHRESH
jgi:hypothetical protein